MTHILAPPTEQVQNYSSRVAELLTVFVFGFLIQKEQDEQIVIV